MQHFTLTLDVATLNPTQHKALIALVESLKSRYVIPTFDVRQAELLKAQDQY